jgi:hypothetical protein
MEAGAAIDRAGWLATVVAVLIAGLLGRRPSPASRHPSNEAADAAAL